MAGPLTPALHGLMYHQSVYTRRCNLFFKAASPKSVMEMQRGMVVRTSDMRTAVLSLALTSVTGRVAVWYAAYLDNLTVRMKEVQAKPGSQ